MGDLRPRREDERRRGIGSSHVIHKNFVNTSTPVSCAPSPSVLTSTRAEGMHVRQCASPQEGEDAGARDACIRRTQTGMHMYVRFFFLRDAGTPLLCKKGSTKSEGVLLGRGEHTHKWGTRVGRARIVDSGCGPCAFAHVRPHPFRRARMMFHGHRGPKSTTWKKVSHACAGTSRASAGGSGGGARAESARIVVRVFPARKPRRSSQTHSTSGMGCDTHRVGDVLGSGTGALEKTRAFGRSTNFMCVV